VLQKSLPSPPRSPLSHFLNHVENSLVARGFMGIVLRRSPFPLSFSFRGFPTLVLTLPPTHNPSLKILPGKMILPKSSSRSQKFSFMTSALPKIIRRHSHSGPDVFLPSHLVFYIPFKFEGSLWPSEENRGLPFFLCLCHRRTTLPPPWVV